MVEDLVIDSQLTFGTEDRVRVSTHQIWDTEASFQLTGEHQEASPMPALLKVAGRTSRMWLGQYFL